MRKFLRIAELQARTLMTAPHVRVAVVIPLGKREGNVLRCVQAALAQTLVPHQVIVVANHAVSVQQARDLLAPVLAKPNLIIIDGEACKNANEARNLGAREAGAPWIALLDSDDWWEPEHLAESIRLANRPESPADFVYGSIRVHQAQGVTALSADHFSAEQTAENYLLAYRPAQTSSFVISRALMLTQPWADGLRRHQDYEWFARATKTCKTVVNPEVRVNVEWLDFRRHQAHRDCWSVVEPWRAAVQRSLFRRHHRSLIKSALRSHDRFVFQLLMHYAVDACRSERQFLGP